MARKLCNHITDSRFLLLFLVLIWLCAFTAAPSLNPPLSLTWTSLSKVIKQRPLQPHPEQKNILIVRLVKICGQDLGPYALRDSIRYTQSESEVSICRFYCGSLGPRLLISSALLLLHRSLHPSIWTWDIAECVSDQL